MCTVIGRLYDDLQTTISCASIPSLKGLTGNMSLVYHEERSDPTDLDGPWLCGFNVTFRGHFLGYTEGSLNYQPIPPEYRLIVLRWLFLIQDRYAYDILDPD